MNVVSEAATVVSYIEDRLGLSFAGARRDRLLGALERARSNSGARSYRAFHDALQTRDAVFDDVVGMLTVGETYFFRERPQLDLLRLHILPAAAAARPSRPVQLWSAGCASGEEAYTLAIVAEQAGLADRCQVTGTDLSAGAVARAERGLYGRWALRSVTEGERHSYFRRLQRHFAVEQRFQDRVRFLRHNLLDRPPAPSRFDVVFCRNVLIYLTPEAVLRAAVVLRDALAAGGWLVTASGDPPLEIDGLQRVRTPHGLAYRRAPVAARRNPHVLPHVAPPQRSRPRRAAATPAAPPPPPLRPQRQTASTPVDVPSRADIGRQDEPARAELADHVRALGDAGRLDDAAAVATEAVVAHPLDVELRYLAAVVELESGRLEGAAAAAAAAVYLDPDLAAAHLLLGQIEHARGNQPRARRSFRNAARLLQATPGDVPVDLAGGVPAAHLAAVAARYLHEGHEEAR